MQYTFDVSNNDIYVVRDLFVKIKFLDSVLSNTLIYYTYSMQDSDTPEIIADKYYDDPQRHWIIMYTNKIVDPYFDFPLKQKDLENNLIEKYGSLVNAQATLDHIELQTVITSTYLGSVNTAYSNVTLNSAFTYDFSLNQVQTLTLPTISNPVIPYSTVTYECSDGTIVNSVSNLVAINAYDNAVAINESKRTIKILDKQYVGQVEAELKALLKQ